MAVLPTPGQPVDVRKRGVGKSLMQRPCLPACQHDVKVDTDKPKRLRSLQYLYVEPHKRLFVALILPVGYCRNYSDARQVAVLFVKRACHHIGHAACRHFPAAVDPVPPGVQYLAGIVCKHLLFRYLVMIYYDPLVAKSLSEVRSPPAAKVCYDVKVVAFGL